MPKTWVVPIDVAKLAHTMQKFYSNPSVMMGGLEDTSRDAIRNELLSSSLWNNYHETIDQTSVLARSHVMILI